jgi:succinoglycan biosynthesis protein ExoU
VETQNLGPAGARNRALAASHAPFFCVLDADDYMLPGRIARLIASGTGQWDLLADDIIILPQQAQLSFSLQRGGDIGDGRNLDVESFVLGNISQAGRPRGELGFLKPLVSRAFMRRHGLLYDENIRLGEDYAFYLQALLRGAKFRLVSACGYVAVERSDSLSARHCADDLRRLLVFDEAILQGNSSLPAAQRGALDQHRAATRNKFVYAAALEKKQANGLASGLACLARSPAALPYVLAETLRAKARALRPLFGPSFVAEPRGLRFLIGLPLAEFADIRPLAPHQRPRRPVAEPQTPPDHAQTSGGPGDFQTGLRARRDFARAALVLYRTVRAQTVKSAQLLRRGKPARRRTEAP